MLITPLTGIHNRQGFNCGRVELNDWLRTIARQHQDKGLSKCFVAVQENHPAQICGYYALALCEVDTCELSEQRRKKLPRMIPGVRLGRLAVDQRFQGKRLGEMMLMNAIERAQRIHGEAGVVGIFVDALDHGAAEFYIRYGFEALTSAPLKLFLPTA